MIHPLVGNDERTFGCSEVGDGILCQYGKIVGIDQFRYAVVDLRVDMIGTARKDDASFVICFHIAERLFSFGAYICSDGFQFFPGGFACVHNICYRKFFKFPCKGFRNSL